MKILLVSDARRTGGAEHYLFLLAVGLIQAGHKVDILCPTRNEWSNLAERSRQAGATVHQVPLLSRNDLGCLYFLSSHILFNKNSMGIH